jgi:hypothetical protein
MPLANEVDMTRVVCPQCYWEKDVCASMERMLLGGYGVCSQCWTCALVPVDQVQGASSPNVATPDGQTQKSTDE